MPPWFQVTQAAPGVFQTCEPAVHSFFRAWSYTVIGRDAVLQFDFGTGLQPCRPALPLGALPVIAVASHAHIDHVGGLHEFETRLGHAAEAASFATMDDRGTLQHIFRDQVHGPAFAHPPLPGFRLADWRLTPAPLTATLAEGARIDLGSRAFTVLHLPGHSPGSIALFDEVDGLLLAGDAIYDDDLVDDTPGASIPDYLATMERLSRFDCRLALAGHGTAFDGPRLRAIAQDYLRARG